MTSPHLSRIAAGLSKWLNRTDEDKIVSLLEKTIPIVSAEIERITTSRERMRLFGSVVEDNNPIHYIKEKAVAKGLDDTPVMGTHTAAYAEHFAQRIVDRINELDTKGLRIIIRGQDITLRGPVYPDQSISWNVGEKGYREATGGINLEISGKSKGIEVADVSIKLGTSLFPATPKPDEGKEQPVVFSKTYRFDEEKSQDFNTAIQGYENGYALIGLPALYIPSALVELLRERTLRREGTNRSMNFEYVQIPMLKTPVKVDIFSPKREPREIPVEGEPNQKKYLYKDLAARCTQEGIEIARGTVTCVSDYNLNITRTP